MARRAVQHHTGFTFNYTDLNSNVFPPKDSCVIDSMGWEDLDGDGCIDFVCIGTESGDYEDTDHEVVAIHTPSGNRMWTALRGEASKKLSLVGGVVVVSTNSGNQLRGLDPRTGQQLWQIQLEDAIEESSFDGDDTAPTIADFGGPWAGFQCVDQTAHIIDVRNGQLLKSFEGYFCPHVWNLPGLAAFKTEDANGDDSIIIWDLAQGRPIYQMRDGSACTVYGGGYFGFIHDADSPQGYATRLSMFATQGFQPAGAAWLRTGDGSRPSYGSSQYGSTRAFYLSGRVVFCDPHDDDHSAWVANLTGQENSVAEPWNPPKPNHVLRGMAWSEPVLATVWQKAKGTERMVACGNDPSTLQTLWMAEGLGGYPHDNAMHVAPKAVLVPRSSDTYFSPTNPAALVHLDPANGQVVSEYPIEATDCVTMARHFLVGCPDYFSGGVPVAYDTWNRVRVL